MNNHEIKRILKEIRRKEKEVIKQTDLTNDLDLALAKLRGATITEMEKMLVSTEVFNEVYDHLKTIVKPVSVTILERRTKELDELYSKIKVIK